MIRCDPRQPAITYSDRLVETSVCLDFTTWSPFYCPFLWLSFWDQNFQVVANPWKHRCFRHSRLMCKDSKVPHSTMVGMLTFFGDRVNHPQVLLACRFCRFFFPRLRGHCDWRTQWQRSLGSTGTTGGASLGGVLLLADLSGGLPMRDQDAGIQVGHVCWCVQCIFSKPCHAVPSLFLGSKLQNYRLGTGSIVAYQPVSQFEREENQNWKAVFLKSYEKSLLKVICGAKPNKSQALSQEFDRSHCSKLFFFSNGSACLWFLSLLQCPGAAEAWKRLVWGNVWLLPCSLGMDS